MLRVTLTLVFVVNVFCRSGERQGRVFGYGSPHTVTLTEEKLVTVWEPSSCIYIAPSLKPCFKVKNFRNFPIFGVQRPTTATSLEQSQQTKQVTPVQSASSPNGTVITALSWGEYLGFRAPTVTVVSTQIKTTTVVDPNVFVKFTVRGCRPFDLPPDMETCSIEATPTLDIQPTSVERSPKAIAPTAIKGFLVSSSANVNGLNSIEGSEEETFLSAFNHMPTQILDGN